MIFEATSKAFQHLNGGHLLASRCIPLEHLIHIDKYIKYVKMFLGGLRPPIGLVYPSVCPSVRQHLLVKVIFQKKFQWIIIKFIPYIIFLV